MDDWCVPNPREVSRLLTRSHFDGVGEKETELMDKAIAIPRASQLCVELEQNLTVWAQIGYVIKTRSPDKVRWAIESRIETMGSLSLFLCYLITLKFSSDFAISFLCFY